jgi:excisionase family DNA binding protein
MARTATPEETVEATTNDLPSLVKVEDLARKGDVSQNTIRRLIRSGKLPAVKIGRRVRIPR